MLMRQLARTGESISAVGFGCVGLLRAQPEEEVESRATLLQAIDRGMTHLDTAASYQAGRNEQFVGAAIKGRRDRVFVATKCGHSIDSDGAVRADNKPATILSSCDASLARLGVERIDLLYLHRIDKSVPIEDSVGTLSELVRAGKVRYIGLSECGAQTLRRACAVHPVAAVQSEYSLWARDIEESVLPACRELDVSLVAYSPLGRGFLAGKYRSSSEVAPNDRNRPCFQDEAFEHNLSILDAMRDFAARKQCTPAQLALAWVLAQGDDILPITGMKTRTHLEDNLGALNVTLTAAEANALRDRIAALEPRGERHAAGNLAAMER
jgi:aryl-alcohol dehydrogenase-like predicted oxidoreductase